MKLLIATSNKNKLKELKSLLKDMPFKLISIDQVKSIPKSYSVQETYSSFKQNATLKAKAYGKLSNYLSLSDDSGLMIDHLNGQPGVQSHLFASDGHDKARSRILQLLKVVSKSKRTAQFKCVLVLFDPQTNSTKTFTGITHGHISFVEKGTAGFGYDSIFIPNSSTKTFAQINPNTKNQLSHRGKAFQKLIKYLKIHPYGRQKS